MLDLTCTIHPVYTLNTKDLSSEQTGKIDREIIMPWLEKLWCGTRRYGEDKFEVGRRIF